MPEGVLMASLRLHGLCGKEQRGGRRYQGQLCLVVSCFVKGHIFCLLSV